MKQFLLALVLLSGFSSASFGQDAIYTANGNKLENARLTGVTDGKVSFSVQKQDKTSTFSFQRQNVLFAFSNTGNFLVISELGDDLTLAQQRLQAFLSAPLRPTNVDYLIKAVPLTVIPATIAYENETIVNYKTQEGKSASIPKSELIGILYRDGKHLLTQPIDAEVASLLIDARKQVDKNAVTVNQPSPSSSSVPVNQTVQTPVPMPETPKAATPQQAVQEVEKPQVTTVTTTITKKSESGKLSLSEEDYQYYRRKALQKVDEFVSYLNVITDKKLSASEKDNAIAQAAKLFMPAATIEVTSNSRPGARRYPIKDYLTRLKLLPYSSTKIEWSEVQYIKELSQAADGNYYGIITGQQTFAGYGANSEDIIYSDITKKNVRVKLQQYEKVVGGIASLNWDVLLGSIGVAAN
ncbi:hypothetical protein LC612_39855 [Nostoc sp. CHAB 5834]|nr:hypothetical protein [Nostoc sp. CHAB 5834]